MNKMGIVVLIVLILGAGAYLVMNSSYSPNSASAMNPLAAVQTTTPQTTAPSTVSMGTAKEFLVGGNEFAFSPNTLTVNKGDTVKVTFTNNGKYPHNFVINELNVKGKTIQPGESDTVSFTADKAGSFEYYCSVDSHKDKGMTGTITVQ